MFCTVHVQCTHSARYSARHSARPQNAVNTTSFPKNNQKTQKKKIFLQFFVNFQQNANPMVFTAFCGRALCGMHCNRALCVALYVHCAKHSLCNSASGGVEAHSLFVGSSCEDERVFGLGLWHVQKGICSQLAFCTAINKKILCFFVCWVAALKMRACLD